MNILALAQLLVDAAALVVEVLPWLIAGWAILEKKPGIEPQPIRLWL